MTIKQQGGIFGRNPTFNNVTVDGVLAVDGSVSVPPDSISGDAINGGTATPANVTASGTVTTANLAVAKGSEGNYANFSGDNASGGRGLSLTSSTNYGSNGAKHTFNAKSGSGAIAFATGAKNRQLIDYNGDIVFYKDDGVTTGATWDASAGNLSFASGNGIDFSATAGTGTSELFDDYEEGTWTPEITSGATGVTYSTQVGHYTKVGNLVTFSGRITTTAATADANQFRIGGLPFTAANLTFGGAYMTYANSNFQASTTANNPTLAVAQNQSRMDFYATNGAPIAGTSFPNLAAAIVWFAGHFYTV